VEGVENDVNSDSASQRSTGDMELTGEDHETVGEGLAVDVEEPA